MATYCIGDVQGCFVELQTLLQQINFNTKRDRLWFTGDLVNRGPQSLEVLRFIKSLNKYVTIVLGNHDLYLLARAAKQVKRKESDTLDAVINAKDCEALCTWLRQQPLLHHDAKLGYTMVHAGLPPQWNLYQAQQYAQEVEQVLRGPQHLEFFANLYGNEPDCWRDDLSGWPRLRLITNYLTRLRFCDKAGRADFAKKGRVEDQADDVFKPWFKFPQRASHNLKIVFGHWAALGGETNEPNVFALDTGCVWGNYLTAMCLEDGQRIKVPNQPR